MPSNYYRIEKNSPWNGQRTFFFPYGINPLIFLNIYDFLSFFRGDNYESVCLITRKLFESYVKSENIRNPWFLIEIIKEKEFISNGKKTF